MKSHHTKLLKWKLEHKAKAVADFSDSKSKNIINTVKFVRLDLAIAALEELETKLLNDKENGKDKSSN